MAFHLAQINIAKFRLPADHPVNADFVGNLDRVNAIAETQPGFVWRLVGDGNNALDISVFDDPDVAINMSVWTDLDALAEFVYRTPAHLEIMRRRREWFEHIDVYMALWWVYAGHVPTPLDGKERLEILARCGPTQDAFTFKKPFPPPGENNVRPVLDDCA